MFLMKDNRIAPAQVKVSASCPHHRAANYDPAKVVKGQPIEVMSNGRMWCFDCEKFFTYPFESEPASPSPSYTLAELEALARHYDKALSLSFIEKLTLSTFLAWLAQQEREAASEADDK